MAQFFFGGAGPSHSKVSNAFTSAGYADADPYSPREQSPNKETRVRTVLTAAQRRPDGARKLVERLLTELRVHGCFDPSRDNIYDRDQVRVVQQAFARIGWTLSQDGTLAYQGVIDLNTGGREALEEQLDRLRRSTEDPGQLLGTAKDLLESVAKFVLEELSYPVPSNASFDHLWHLARDRLGILPQQVDQQLVGERQVKEILQSSWKIAQQVNELRSLQGAGHGRTLPTGVSADLALLVVREACSVAEYTLRRLDRARGFT